jgi:hypothetical protein
MLPLVAAIAILAALAPVAAQKKEPPPDYFPLPANAWWKYKSTTADGKTSEFTMKVLSTEGTGAETKYLVEIQSTFQPIHEWYSKPSGWVVWHREAFPKNAQMVVAFDPARQYLKNPLATGATWGWKGKGMMGVDVDETSTVAGPDAVTVPAGKFQAMKVTTKLTQGGTPVTKTYWYANHVGLVRSETDTGSVKSTSELVDYSFKKP